MAVGYVGNANAYSPPPAGGNNPDEFAKFLANRKQAAAPPPPAPPPPSSQGSADWNAFANSNGPNAQPVTGDAPSDLQPPPGTTAAQIDAMNPGLLDNVNKMKWNGTPEGDLYAQQHGFKNLKDMLSSNSPEAAKATAQLAWDAKAANNAGEAGAPSDYIPDSRKGSNMLTGIRGSGEVDPHSTGAILQDKIVHGQSMNGKVTSETSRTYADGSCKSNATMVGNKIAGFFKEVLGAIIPPMKDLIQMAQDGAEKERDQHAGDRVAAHHDDDNVKQDAKDFGKDVAEFGAQALADLIPGVGEAVTAGLMAARVGRAAGKVGEGAEKAGTDAAKAGDSVKGATQDGIDTIKKTVTDVVDKIQDKMFSNDFIQSLTKVSKDATPEEKRAYVKEKVKEAVDQVQQQLGLPQSNTPQSQQNGGANESVLAQLLSEVEAALAHMLASSSTSRQG